MVVATTEALRLPLTARAASLRIGLYLLSQVVAGSAQFAFGLIVARNVGPIAYGDWGWALSYVMLFSVLADLGLSTLLLRELSGQRAPAGIWGATLALKVPLAVLVMAAALLLQPLLYGGASIRVLVLLLGTYMIAQSFGQVAFAVFRAHDRPGHELLVRAVFAGLLLGGGLALGSLRVEVAMYAWLAATAASLSTLMALAFAAVRLPATSLRVRMRDAAALLPQAVPLGVAMALTSVYYYADSTVMGILGQTRQVGLYSAAYLPIIGTTMAITAVRAVYLPRLSQAAHSSQKFDVVARSFRTVSLAMAVPIALSGFMLAGPIMSLFFGEEYREGALALRLLFVATGVMFFSSHFGAQLIARARDMSYLKGTAVGAVVNVLLIALLVPRWSLNGAALGTLIAESAVCAYMYGMTRQTSRKAVGVRGSIGGAVRQ